MSRTETFWSDQNVWWSSASMKMKAGTDQESLWVETETRVRALVGKVSAARDLNPEDVDDLVQTILLRLCRASFEGESDEPLGSNLLRHLTQQNAPAHYLRNCIRNQLLNEGRRDKRARKGKSAEKYREFVKRLSGGDPAREAERNEACRRVRYVVNHLLCREDRQILGWKYFDGLSSQEIAYRLKISHLAAMKRLLRARAQVKHELSNLTM